jgi:hypothetical protein
LRREIQREAMRERAHTFVRTHGRSRSSEFWSWVNARARCNKSKHQLYKFYGARGIHVCPEWNFRGGGGFEAFFASMEPKPSAKHSLERKDNDGPYSPENCVWATKKVQERNKRGLRRLDLGGNQNLILTDWAKALNSSVYKLNKTLQDCDGELFFAVLRLKPSHVGMRSLAEHQAQQDAAERERQEREQEPQMVVPV